LCQQVQPRETDESWQACQALCSQLAWATCHEYDQKTNPEFPFALLNTLVIQPIRHPL
jgi:hypothetical protein